MSFARSSLVAAVVLITTSLSAAASPSRVTPGVQSADGVVAGLLDRVRRVENPEPASPGDLVVVHVDRELAYVGPASGAGEALHRVRMQREDGPVAANDGEQVRSMLREVCVRRAVSLQDDGRIDGVRFEVACELID